MKILNVATCTLSTLVFFVSASALASGNYYANSWKFRPVNQPPTQFRPVIQNNAAVYRPAPAYAGNTHRSVPQSYRNMPYRPRSMQQGFMPGQMNSYGAMMPPMLPVAPPFARQYGWPSRYNPMLPNNMNPRVIARVPASPRMPIQHNYGGKLYQFRPAGRQHIVRHPMPRQYAYPVLPAPSYAQYQPYAYPMRMMPAYPMYNMPYNPYRSARNYFPQQNYMMPRASYPMSAQVMANHYYRQPVMNERRARDMTQDGMAFDIRRLPFKVNRLSSVVDDNSHEIYRRYRWRPVN